MRIRVIADENIDHRMIYRLKHYGHDVEHVDFMSALGKGSSDERIARYSVETDRLILTNDDDFLTEFDPGDYTGVLLIEDDTLSTREISDIVHTISETIEGQQIENVFYVSSNWLS